MKGRVLGGMPGLAACVRQAAPGAETCRAAALQGLVGQDTAVLDSLRFAQPLRVIRPGMAVAMDYAGTRLTIAIDAADRMARVTCGQRRLPFQRALACQNLRAVSDDARVTGGLRPGR